MTDSHSTDAQTSDAQASAAPTPADDGIQPYLPESGAVTVFSAEWCGHCKQLKTMLTHAGIPFREVLIEQDPVAERIASEANGGSWIIPTVVMENGDVLVHPGITGVQAAFERLEQE